MRPGRLLAAGLAALWATLIASAALGAALCHWEPLHHAFSDLGVPGCPANPVFNTGLVVSAALLAAAAGAGRDAHLLALAALLGVVAANDETKALIHYPAAAALMVGALLYAARRERRLEAAVAATLWLPYGLRLIGAAIPEAATALVFTLAALHPRGAPPNTP